MSFCRNQNVVIISAMCASVYTLHKNYIILFITLFMYINGLKPFFVLVNVLES